MKKFLRNFSCCLIGFVVLLGLIACDGRQLPIVNPIIEEGPYYIEDNALPEISLSPNDTSGTISWNNGQEILLGENEYSWTFVPTNVTAFERVTGSLSLTFVNRGDNPSDSNGEDLPQNIVAESITQSSVIIYTTGSAISLVAENFVLPQNTTFVSATSQTDIIDAGNYLVSVVVNANTNYTINGATSYRFNNVSVSVTQSIPEEQSFGKIINHENAQKEDLLELSNSQISSIKEDLKIAYFHTSHGNQIIEGNYAINYLFGNNRSKDFSDAIVYDSYGANMYVDAGQKDSAIEDMGTDIGSLVTATKSFFGDAGQSGDLLYEVGKDLEVNVVIWSWCGELSVFTEERVQQYLDDLNELENYYNGINNSRKIVFVYMTGHLYNEAYYIRRTDDTKETNIRNNKLIRDYCKQNNKILYDFEDIESYNPDGEYFGDVCNDASLYWNGGVAEWWARDWQNSHTENVDWVSLQTLKNSNPPQSFTGFKSITQTSFSHVEYSIIVLSKAYAFWGLLNHLTTVV